MKKLFLILTLIAVLISNAFPAQAAERQSATNYFNVRGILRAVDPSSGTIIVHVKVASPNAKSYIGQDLTVRVAADTEFWMKNKLKKWSQTSIYSLVVGKPARIRGAISGTVFYATQVKQGMVIPGK